MSKKRHSFARQLSISLMLMAIPIFMLSLGIFFYRSSQLIKQKTTERTVSTLNTTVQRIINYMNAIKTAAQADAWLVEDNFTPDSLAAITRRIVSRNPNVQGCSVNTEPNMFPEKGRFFAIYSFRIKTEKGKDTIETVTEPDYAYYDQTWYKTALNTEKGHWDDPFNIITRQGNGNTDYHEAMASYCLPIYTNVKDDYKKIAGVLSTDFTFQQLADIINAAQPPYPNAYYMMLSSNGTYLVHPNTQLLIKKTIFTGADSYKNADIIALGHEMTNGHHGTMHAMIDNVYSHVCYCRIPDTTWSLALVCPDNDILAHHYKLACIVIATVVIGLLIVLWMCQRLVKQNMKPIHQLLNATEKITNGDYNEVIPFSKKKDAIAQLQNSFASMQQSIIANIFSINHTAKEIKRQNVELEHAKELVEQSMAKKNLFIENMLHQIRTPLNIITGFADVLRDCRTASQEAPSNLLETEDGELNNITKIMKHNADHLNRMILMLYDSSETEMGHHTLYERNDEVPCNQIILESIRYTRKRFPTAKIQFETTLPDNLHIRTNYLKLMRSIRELLFNAAKYSDSEHITIRVTQTQTIVQIVIEDVGDGLSKESQSFIFEPFMKVDDLSEGLGLGLPLAKHHIVCLGGDLKLDSSYQNGCRFIITLPK